jgi:hypothetical protein
MFDNGHSSYFILMNISHTFLPYFILRKALCDHILIVHSLYLLVGAKLGHDNNGRNSKCPKYPQFAFMKIANI